MDNIEVTSESVNWKKTSASKRAIWSILNLKSSRW